MRIDGLGEPGGGLAAQPVADRPVGVRRLQQALDRIARLLQELAPEKGQIASHRRLRERRQKARVVFEHDGSAGFIGCDPLPGFESSASSAGRRFAKA